MRDGGTTQYTAGSFLAFGFWRRGDRGESLGAGKKESGANRGWTSERPFGGVGGAFAGARERLREGVRFRNGKANHGKKRMTTLGVSALIWIATIRIF